MLAELCSLMILRVHPLTYHSLVTKYGSHEIRVTPSHTLMPLLSFKPQVPTPRDMMREIILHGKSEVLACVREDAGANLYEIHMDEMIQHMCRAVDLGGHAEVAMKEYYVMIGLTIDDLDYGTAYKRWQRFKVKKNSTNFETKSLKPVLRKFQRHRDDINLSFEYASRVISADPSLYMTPDGRPILHMVIKVIIYAMAAHGWRPSDIADKLGRYRCNVSYHLRSFRDMVSSGSVLMP